MPTKSTTLLREICGRRFLGACVALAVSSCGGGASSSAAAGTDEDGSASVTASGDAAVDAAIDAGATDAPSHDAKGSDDDGKAPSTGDSGSNETGAPGSPSGQLETSFGELDGCHWIDYDHSAQEQVDNIEPPTGLALDSSGHILVSGSYDGYGSPPNRPLLSRTTATGQADATFGQVGSAQYPMLGNELASAIVVSPGGLPTALTVSETVGGPNVAPMVFRALVDGSLDTSFAPPASLPADLGALAYDAAGNLLLLDGSSLERLLPSGALDITFAGTGSVTLAIQGAQVFVDSVNRPYVSGTSQDASGVAWAVARYTVGGALDPTFGTGGVVVVDGFDMSLESVAAMDSTGTHLYLLGSTGVGSLQLAHVTAAGLDLAFGSQGYADVDTGCPASQALAVYPDGRVLVGVGCGDSTARVGRVLASGQADTSFGSGGWFIATPASYGDAQSLLIWGLSLTSDGAPVVLFERDYQDNLYQELTSIVCELTP